MPPSADDAAQEVDLEELQALLDALPAPLQALDVSALDGYLCGVLLQPNAVETSRWMRCASRVTSPRRRHYAATSSPHF